MLISTIYEASPFLEYGMYANFSFLMVCRIDVTYFML